MNNELTAGTCRLCGRTFGKRQMTNHLKACWDQHALRKPRKASERWFHLVVEGRYAPDYWLHLQAPAKATFGDVDNVLRRIWLECCGHLSAFEFPVKRARRRSGGPLYLDTLSALLTEPDYDADYDRIMGERLGARLNQGLAFTHQYDFGSTTDLALRVAGEHTAPAVKGTLKLLARNEPPDIPCSICNKPATELCQECADDSGAVLCDACAAKHKCDPEMRLALVNSPRAGVCGYCGPSVEP